MRLIVVFDPNSQIFRDPPNYIDKKMCEEIITYYGYSISPSGAAWLWSLSTLAWIPAQCPR